MKKKRVNKKAKNKGSIANLFIYFILPTVAVVFLFLILQTEIKFLYKEKDKKEMELGNLQSMIEVKLVEVQKNSAENVIIGYARDSLRMVRINNSVDNIYLSNLKINQIKRIVDSKYE
ncbi:MAG: hypothetical protein L3J41_01105 [Melioribacteraceae bacterium]|nr:hypothetical protein [Melioribacteraceae bacterium]